MTDRPGLLIAVMTADCIPVLVVDPVRRAVGAFHAGWRGTVERIVELGVARDGEAYGSRTGDLLAAIEAGDWGLLLHRWGGGSGAVWANFLYAGELFSGSLDAGDLRVDLVEANGAVACGWAWGRFDFGGGWVYGL